MFGTVYCIQSISKVANSVLGLFETRPAQETLLAQIEAVLREMEESPDILLFFEDRHVNKEEKKKVIDLWRGSLHEYFVNALHFIADTGLIFYIKLFLSTLKSKILEQIKVKRVFIYSAFDIVQEQKRELERIWTERLREFTCEFIYAIDKSLKLGVKVQVDDYMEEFTVRSNLMQLKLKLDTIFS